MASYRWIRVIKTVLSSLQLEAEEHPEAQRILDRVDGVRAEVRRRLRASNGNAPESDDDGDDHGGDREDSPGDAGDGIDDELGAGPGARRAPHAGRREPLILATPLRVARRVRRHIDALLTDRRRQASNADSLTRAFWRELARRLVTFRANPPGLDAQLVASLPNPPGLDAQLVASLPNPSGLDAQLVASLPNPSGLDAQLVAIWPVPERLDA